MKKTIAKVLTVSLVLSSPTQVFAESEMDFTDENFELVNIYTSPVSDSYLESTSEESDSKNWELNDVQMALVGGGVGVAGAAVLLENAIHKYDTKKALMASAETTGEQAGGRVGRLVNRARQAGASFREGARNKFTAVIEYKNGAFQTVSGNMKDLLGRIKGLGNSGVQKIDVLKQKAGSLREGTSQVYARGKAKATEAGKGAVESGKAKVKQGKKVVADGTARVTQWGSGVRSSVSKLGRLEKLTLGLKSGGLVVAIGVIGYAIVRGNSVAAMEEAIANLDPICDDPELIELRSAGVAEETISLIDDMTRSSDKYDGAAVSRINEALESGELSEYEILANHEAALDDACNQINNDY